MVSEHWTTVGNIAEVFDGPHATPKKIETGPYFLSISSLISGRLDLSLSAHVSKEDFKKWTKRVTPTFGDMLFSYETRLGEAALMPKGVKACLGRRMGLLRPKTEQVIPEYLLYAYLSPDFQAEIKTRTNYGATVERIALKELPHFPIRIPPLQEQKNIAHILGTLDDRIELNRKMNETLEGMAQALFKSWFVDFDPVLDNALAKGKEIPEELRERAKARLALGDKRRPLPEDIRSLFPDEFFLTDEMGWIPMGWELSSLKNIASNPRRGIQAEMLQPECPYIGLQDMPQKSIALAKWGLADGLASSKFSFEKGEILFGKLRPYFHKVGIAPVSGVCSTDILIVLPKKSEYFSLVLGHVTSVEFIEYVTAASTGTKMPRTNWKDMGSYELALPPIHVANKLTVKLITIVEKIIANIEFNQSLEKLRDTLLPKLLSGELRIPDAEKMVEEV